jgi:hypothetical protein
MPLLILFILFSIIGAFMGINPYMKIDNGTATSTYTIKINP